MIGRTNNPFIDLYKGVEQVSRLGVDFTELLLESLPDLDKLDVKRLKKAAGKLKINAHFPFTWTVYSKSSSVNKAILKQFEVLCKKLKQVDCGYIVMHVPQVLVLGNKELMQHTKRMVAIAKKNKIKLAIENLPWLTEVREIKKLLAIKGLYFVLDVGHANLKRSKDGFDKLLKNFHKKLIAFHLSDNKGEDSHFPLRKGNIDFKKFFRLVKKYKLQDKPFNIEIGGYPKKTVLECKKFIEDNIR